MVPVLDGGYVRLVDWMGSDLTVVNAARASYERESRALTDKDRRLIRFLAEHEHTSPFRHCYAQFEVRAPLMVARQWWRHVVGAATLEDGTAWNEASRRYVTEEPEFYVPDVWRSAPAHRKQGSGGPVAPTLSDRAEARMRDVLDHAMRTYRWMLDHGIAPEQARLVLPAYAMYVRWRWTASLHALIHFLCLRQGEDAQSEIRAYARAVHQLIWPLWPESLAAWGLVWEGGDDDATTAGGH